ncbi:hypothetical protein NP233_g4858 [Leucocoprinus birnbaumii]|uniref:Exonuclease V n=1 Tax=Leucocoprinus birnbaumii TaxID=56174 RepID=A0AAD5YWX1_9AGAR|nr:hypothetical protein NP233_g4858 [Leucocoprinus birnbaumii]
MRALAASFTTRLPLRTPRRAVHSTTSMAATDEDEFAAYDFAEFTEEDFAQIDADVAKKVEHLAKLTVAYETPKGQISSPRPSSSKRNRPSFRSPLESFRRYGVLSVTDLVSPSWYDISRPASKLIFSPLDINAGERPKSFRSASGKEIKTDGTVAAHNDVITSKGKAIHKTLEREVKPQETVVEVATTEERWALRLVNMMISLRGMRLEGFTREMPVFGVEDGEVIVGIIDELVYQPVPNEASNDEPADTSDPSQPKIDSFFTPSKSSKKATASMDPSYTLQVIDTKTRQRPSLPLEEDTLSSRLQLMLYHRLLSKLVVSESSFNFMEFWQIANVNPERQLSWRFIEQAGLIAGEGEFQVDNLNDLSVLWHDLILQLNITGVDDQLTLIYRLQTPGRRKKARSIPSPSQLIPVSIAAEATSFENPSSKSPSLSLPTTSIANGVTDPLPGNSANEVGVPENPREDTAEQDGVKEVQPQILGTKVFNYDAGLLFSYLTDVLAWWRGQRKPKGVPVELARRCTTCEYCNDCEWRAERAKAFREQAALERESSIDVSKRTGG